MPATPSPRSMNMIFKRFGVGGIRALERKDVKMQGGLKKNVQRAGPYLNYGFQKMQKITGWIKKRGTCIVGNVGVRRMEEINMKALYNGRR
ncbi:hypothetical protein Tco_0630965, partial [Tanacetum coccineum]